MSIIPSDKITYFIFRILYEDEETMSLIIKDVKESDGGKYTFTAENELGTDTVEMNLTVQGKILSFEKIYRTHLF